MTKSELTRDQIEALVEELIEQMSLANTHEELVDVCAGVDPKAFNAEQIYHVKSEFMIAHQEIQYRQEKESN